MLWCHLFITRWGWGFYGAAYAINITYILNMVIQDYLCTINKQIKRSF